MPEIAFRSCYLNVPKEDRLEYEREQAALSAWNRSPGIYQQNRFEQWLMQPHVLKEWYERANRWRPEARRPGSVRWLPQMRLTRVVESHLRWTPQIDFEHYTKCIVGAVRTVDPTSQVPGRLLTNYTMYLYMDKAGGRQVFKHENNDSWRPYNCDTDPIWTSVIDESTKCCQWLGSIMSTHTGLREDLDRMGFSNAAELPPVRMINKAPFYWKRVWALVRANALLDYWRAIIYVPGGSGAKRAEQSFESHVASTSK